MNQDPDQERNVALIINPKDYSKAKYTVLNRQRTLAKMHADNNTKTFAHQSTHAHAHTRMHTQLHTK